MKADSTHRGTASKVNSEGDTATSGSSNARPGSGSVEVDDHSWASNGDRADVEAAS